MCFLELITTMWGERLLCEKFSIDPKIYREWLQRAKKEDTLSSIVDQCLSYCPFSFGHCVVCVFSIYGFVLPLWYLQTLLTVYGRGKCGA